MGTEIQWRGRLNHGEIEERLSHSCPDRLPIPWGSVSPHKCPDCGDSMTLRHPGDGVTNENGQIAMRVEMLNSFGVACPFYRCVAVRCRCIQRASMLTGLPLGKPGDRETRRLRRLCHIRIGKLLKNQVVTMGVLFRQLSSFLGVRVADLHFAEFDAKMCRRALAGIEHVVELVEETATFSNGRYREAVFHRGKKGHRRESVTRRVKMRDRRRDDHETKQRLRDISRGRDDYKIADE